MDFLSLGGLPNELIPPGGFREFGPFIVATDLQYTDMTAAPINGVVSVSFAPAGPNDIDITSSGLSPSAISIGFGESVTFRNTDTVPHLMDFLSLGGLPNELIPPGGFREFGPFIVATDLQYTDMTAAPINGVVSVSFAPAGPNDIDITSSGLSPSAISIHDGETITFRNTDTVPHLMDFLSLGGLPNELIPPGGFREFGPFIVATDLQYTDMTAAPINGVVSVSFAPAGPNDIDITSSGLSPSAISIGFGESVTFRNTDTVPHLMDFLSLGGLPNELIPPGGFREFGPFIVATDLQYTDMTAAPINGVVSVSFAPAGPNDIDITSSGLSPSAISIGFGESVTFRNTDTVPHLMDFLSLGGLPNELIPPGGFREFGPFIVATDLQYTDMTAAPINGVVSVSFAPAGPNDIDITSSGLSPSAISIGFGESVTFRNTDTVPHLMDFLSLGGLPNELIPPGGFREFGPFIVATDLQYTDMTAAPINGVVSVSFAPAGPNDIDITSSGLSPSAISIGFGESVTFRNTDTVPHLMDFLSLGGLPNELIPPGGFREFGPFIVATDLQYTDMTAAPINGVVSVSFAPAGPNDIDITSSGLSPSAISIGFGESVTFRNTDTVPHLMDFLSLGGLPNELIPPGGFREFGPFIVATDLQYTDMTAAPINGVVSVSFAPAGPNDIDITSSGLSPSAISIGFGESVTFRNTDTVPHLMDFLSLGGLPNELIPPGGFREFGPFIVATDLQYTDMTAAPINGVVSVSFAPAGPNDIDITSSGLSPSAISIGFGESVTFRNTDTVPHLMDFLSLGGLPNELIPPGGFREFGPFIVATDLQYTDMTAAPINGVVSVSFAPAGPNDIDITSSGLSPSAISIGFGESVTFRNTDTVPHLMDFLSLGGLPNELIPPGGFREFGPFIVATDLQYTDMTAAPINGVVSVSFAPVANNDVVTTDVSIPIIIPVLSNDQNPLAGPLSVLQTTVPTNSGIAIINPDNTITYTP